MARAKKETLSLISRADGLSAREVACELGIAFDAAEHRLMRYNRDGYLNKVKTGEKKSVYYYQITPKGKSILEYKPPRSSAKQKFKEIKEETLSLISHSNGLSARDVAYKLGIATDTAEHRLTRYKQDGCLDRLKTGKKLIYCYWITPKGKSVLGYKPFWSRVSHLLLTLIRLKFWRIKR